MVKKSKDGGYFQDSDTRKWVYTLPFAPESLAMTLPFAINATVTQGGYVEEHGGIPIKPIQLQGSLGVMPGRRASEPRLRSTDIGSDIFGGTIQAGLNTANSAVRVGSDLAGGASYDTRNLVQDSEVTNQTALGKTTGYYQLRVLTRWFENYANLKKTGAGKEYRLAFCMWKHEAVYLVTPLTFTWSFTAASPLEPVYQLALQAFRCISLDSVGAQAQDPYQPVAQRPGGMARVMQALLDARATIENARDVLTAALGDVDRSLFQPIQQSLLLAKDAVGVPLAFADLPAQVLGLCQGAVVQWISTAQGIRGEAEKFQDVDDKTRDAYRALADAAAGQGGPQAPVAVSRGDGSDVGTGPSSTSGAAYDVFRRPQDYYQLFQRLEPSKMQIPAAAVRQVVQAREAVRALTRLDFERMRDSVQEQSNAFADACGAGNQDFNAVYNRAVTATSKTPTLDDYRILYALNRVVLELSRLSVQGTQVARDRSVDFLAGLATRSGIAFKVPRSKFAVPFPYGSTLEQLAFRYLGDPDRWMEIVALNGLRAPYIDELGFDLPLEVNGSGVEVQVADGTNLVVGQRVFLSANNTPRSPRRILSVEQLPEGPVVLQLDGDPDLDRFTVAGQATLHAFLPETVNSQMLIYIPSDSEPGERDYPVKEVPGIDAFDPLLKVAGVDFLLDSKNRLIVTPDGDNRWSYGLTNIVQTARIRLNLTKGRLLRHPTIGLPPTVGFSTSDVDARQVRAAALTLFDDDPAFTGVIEARVVKAGPALKLAMNVGVRGQSRLIPITLDVTS